MTALLHAGHVVLGMNEVTLLAGLCFVIAFVILVRPASASSSNARRIARSPMSSHSRRRRRGLPS